MKKIFFLLLVVACSGKENDPYPINQIGCQSGIPKDTRVPHVRTVYRCATRKQFTAGNNVAAGGYEYFNEFTDNQWELCAQCH